MVNYETSSISVAYAFTYLPRRILGSLAALEYLGAHLTRMSRTILDIGSGTDAVRVALEYWTGNEPLEIVSVESSLEMRRLAEWQLLT